MIITPERAELVLEVLQMRELGYTQPVIGELLDVPQQTVSYWFEHFGKPIGGDVGNCPAYTNIETLEVTNIHPTPITLYPCRYEDADLSANAETSNNGSKGANGVMREHEHGVYFPVRYTLSQAWRYTVVLTLLVSVI